MARRKKYKSRNASSRNRAPFPAHTQTIQTALQHHQAGDLEQAEILYRQVIQTNSDHPVANHLIGLIALQSGDPEQGIQHLETSIRSNPNMAATHNDLGTAYQAQGRLEEAASSFRCAIDIEPANAHGHYNLGNLMELTGQLELAREEFQKAVECNPRLAEAHCRLGKVFRKMYELPAAYNTLQTALLIQPDHAAIHNELGIVLKKMDRSHEAIEAFGTAIALDKDFGMAYLNLGNAWNDASSPEKAEPFCRRAVELMPRHDGAHNNLGCALLAMGNLKSAAKCFKETLALAPRSANAHNNLAIALHRSGRLRESAASYAASLELKPDDPYTVFNLALVHMELGQSKPTLDLFCRGKELIGPRNYSSSRQNQEKMVALMPLPRAGSLFLHSLLDGHPEISTTPGVYLKGFFGENVWEKLNSMSSMGNSKKKLVENFCYHYDILFDARSKTQVFGDPFGARVMLGEVSGMTTMGKTGNQWLTLDRDQFSNHLLGLLQKTGTLNPQVFFRLIHKAYDQTLMRAEKKKVLFYHIHNPDHYEISHFINWHPHAAFLFIMREPVQGIESWINSVFPQADQLKQSDTEKKDQAVLSAYSKINKQVRDYFRYLSHPVFQLNPTWAVRLEDVKRLPRKTMPALAKWMGITPRDCLYKSSFQDLEYSGPFSTTNPGLRGFDTSNLDRRQKPLFTKKDQFVFKTLFYPSRTKFGYAEQNDAIFRKNLSVIKSACTQPLDFEEALFQHHSGGVKFLKNLDAYRGLHTYLKTKSDLLQDDPSTQVGNISLIPLEGSWQSNDSKPKKRI